MTSEAIRPAVATCSQTTHATPATRKGGVQAMPITIIDPESAVSDHATMPVNAMQTGIKASAKSMHFAWKNTHEGIASTRLPKRLEIFRSTFRPLFITFTSIFIGFIWAAFVYAAVELASCSGTNILQVPATLFLSIVPLCHISAVANGIRPFLDGDA